MWDYLTPFQIIYETARRYKTPLVFWRVPTGYSRPAPQDWDYGIIDHIQLPPVGGVFKDGFSWRA
jgi:hypothetical protein